MDSPAHADYYLFLANQEGAPFKAIQEQVTKLGGFYNGAGWCLDKSYAEAAEQLRISAQLPCVPFPLLGETFLEIKKKYKSSYYQMKVIQIDLELRQIKEQLHITDDTNLEQLLPFEERTHLEHFPLWKRLKTLLDEKKSLQRNIDQQNQAEKIASLALENEGDFHRLLQPNSEEEVTLELQRTSTGVFTGYKIGEVDLTLPGGAISILAGPTSHGKTALLINFTLGAIKQWQKQQQNHSVYFFSYEESGAAITSLFLNTYIGKELSKNNRASIRSYFRNQDMRHLSSCSDARLQFLKKKKEFFDTLIQTGRLRICYSSYSAQELVAAIHFLKKHSNVGLVCIDYMQLIRYSSSQTFSSRQEELKKVCLLLKDCAVETGLPIFIAAQFNRSVVAEADLSPTNIGEAGDIERIASLILGFWNRNFEGFGREGNRNKKGLPIAKENTIYLEILKGREIGASESDLFDFDGNTGKLWQKNMRPTSLNF